MFKKNYINPKVKKIKLGFKKFRNQPNPKENQHLFSYDDCFECYNYSTKDGALKDGYGVKILSAYYDGDDYLITPDCSEIKGIWASRWHNIDSQKVDEYVFFMFEDNKIHFTDLNYPSILVSLDEIFTEIPFMTKIREDQSEAFIFSSPSDNLLLLTKDADEVLTTVPKFMDVCYHYDKTFAITAEVQNALVYSTDDDIKNWKEDNIERIEFSDDRGRLLRLLTFNDYLYVFREFGITKISQYSIKSQFSLDHLYQSQSYIYPESIAICGDKVIFLTKDGLYEFDGNNVKLIEVKCFKNMLLDQAKPYAITFNNSYFLATRMSFEGDVVGCEKEDYVNNAIIVLDLISNNIEIIRGLDIVKFTTISSAKHNKLIAIFRGEYKNLVGEIVQNGQFFDEISSKSWTSTYSDFGYADKLKNITEIHIKTKEDCKISVVSDQEIKQFEVKGSEELQRLNVSIKGRLFKISFQTSSSTGQEISVFNISLTVYES